MLIGWHAGRQPGVSPWWGVPAALFAAGLPFGYVVRAVRRGRLSSHHIPERADRRVPLLFGVLSLLVGLALLVALGAPRDIVAVLVAGGAGLAVYVVITHWWKISIHSGVAAGTAVILIAVYGAAVLFVVLLVPLVGWARVRLNAHTPAQVVVGVLVGTAISATIFPALR